jgi:predicted RNase H-like HicB family nuclease
MKYTIILTEKPDGGIHVSIPALPDCTVEASNRDEAINTAREAIAETIRRSEIVLLEVPQQPKSASSGEETPWDWFGKTQDDATWNSLFDDIERRREATRKAR